MSKFYNEVAMKYFGCKGHCFYSWQAVIVSFFVVLFYELCFSQATHLAETKEVRRGVTQDVFIYEGPIEHHVITGSFMLFVRAPQYLKVNTKGFTAVAFGSAEKNYLKGILTVTPSREAPLGITNCSLVLTAVDEENRASEKSSIEIIIPLKVISQEEYESKKRESRRVFSPAQQRIGFVGGLNFANFNGVDEDGGDIAFSSRGVFGIGGVLELGLGKNIALRLEPMYLEKATEFDSDMGLTRWKVAYFEVPVFLQLAFETNIARPYLIAGPTVGLIVSSKVEFINLDLEYNAIDLVSSIDFGLGFGAGISFPIGHNAIFVEGHYTYGLVDIADDGKIVERGEDFDFEEGVDVKTRGLQIMVGVTFPFGEY